jgi:hypothetical protein
MTSGGIMMLTGISLKQDSDFAYALQNKRNVVVLVDGEVDYTGVLTGYSRDLLQVVGGDQYLRGLVEVREA